MNTEQIKTELKNGVTFEFSNEEDIFEIQFSKRFNKFMVTQNGSVIKSTKSFNFLDKIISDNNLTLSDNN